MSIGQVVFFIIVEGGIKQESFLAFIGRMMEVLAENRDPENFFIILDNPEIHHGKKIK